MHLSSSDCKKRLFWLENLFFSVTRGQNDIFEVIIGQNYILGQCSKNPPNWVPRVHLGAGWVHPGPQHPAKFWAWATQSPSTQQNFEAGWPSHPAPSQILGLGGPVTQHPAQFRAWVAQSPSTQRNFGPGCPSHPAPSHILGDFEH